MVLMLAFTCWSLLREARGDKTHIYRKVVDLVAPGEKFLTEDALRSVFEGLEKRVQCSGVSCGKVRYVEEFWRGRGPARACCRVVRYTCARNMRLKNEHLKKEHICHIQQCLCVRK